MDKVTIKIPNNCNNVKLFNLILSVDLANHHEIGDPLNILEYTIHDNEVTFSILNISNLYKFRNIQFIEWLKLSQGEISVLINWIDTTCINYIAQLVIPESTLINYFTAIKWDGMQIVGNDHATINNPYLVHDEYEKLANNISWFIIKKMESKICEISKEAFLSEWKKVKLLNLKL